jgi:hypothetical protein
MDRRQFLTALSALPVGFTLPAWAGTQAGRRGTLGLNLAGLSYWASEQPFTNLAMGAARWRLQERDKPFDWNLPFAADSQGYPTTIPKNAYLESFLVFTPHRQHLPDGLAVHYEGKGQLDYTGGAQLVSRAPGRDAIRNLHNDGPIIARLVRTDEKDPVRNLRLLVPGTEQDGPFRKPFLDRLSRMSAIRFMDWMNTNNSELVQWQDRPQPARFSQTEGGVAVEHMVALANQLRVAPWFTLPHKADDDHIARFAELVRDTLDSALPVYVEYSNEVWNGTFTQALYAREEGLRRGLSTHDYEAQVRFHSLRTTETLRIWEKVFGAQKDRVLGVYGSHAANGWTSEQILSWDGAADHADFLAVAPYFGGSLGMPDRFAEIASWSLDRLFQELAREIETENRAMIDEQVALAKRFGVGLIAYEGGQHLVGVGPGESDARLEKLFRAANRDPRMGELYRAHLAQWHEAGGGLYTLFNSMGDYSKWGSWGLLEHEADMTPKWQAIAAMLEG